MSTPRTGEQVDPPRSPATTRGLVRALGRGLLILLLAVGGGVLVRRLFLGGLGTRIVWVTFYPAVMIASLYGGWATGLASAGAFVLIAVKGWPLLADAPFVKDSGDWLGVAAFLVNCGMIAAVAEVARRARLRAEEARAHAEAANRAKSVFLASMSHELRTPLNAILGFAKLMRAGSDATAEQRQSLDIINRSGEHLLGLINNVLDMAKVDAGKALVSPSPFDPRALVEDVVTLLRHRAEAKGVRLACEFAPGLPRAVMADEGKLRQVLLNLVGNAVKFTMRGSVDVRVAASQGRREGPIVLAVEVRDTGPGIRPQDRDRIFEPFVQLGHEADQKGSGLGLSIARRFIEAMGGSIRVDSEVGTGSLFRLEVPVSEASEVGVSRTAAEAETLARLAPGQVGGRVLVVDDQPENWQLLRRLLEHAGFEVRVAEDGAQAVEAFRSWRPRFIWMDWRMPVMDGGEATRQIRRVEGGGEVRIAALSASVFQDERERILAAGADAFVPKPIRFGQIYDCMSSLLGVEFVADEATPPGSFAPTVQLDGEAVLALSVDERGELESALVSLDAERITRAVQRVADANPELGRTMQGFVERLEYTALLRELRPLRADAGPRSGVA